MLISILILLLFGVLVTAIFKLIQSRSTLTTSTTKNYVGKNVIITGASSGIGKCLAVKMSELGASKIVIAARRAECLKSTAESCRNVNPKVDVIEIVCDLSQEEGCKKLIEESIKKLDGTSIDYLILNAGRSSVRLFEDVDSLEEYRSLMELNYWGCVAPTFYALPHLKKQPRPSVICAVSSMAGKVGLERRTGYSPTKFALNGFFEALRSELIYGHNMNNRQNPIQITTVCPSYVLSEIHHNAVGIKGQEVEFNRRNFMPTDLCVDHIITAMDKKYPEYLMLWSHTILLALQSILPTFIIDHLKHNAQKQLEIEEKKTN